MPAKKEDEWSEEEVQLLIKLSNESKSDKELCAAFPNRSYAAIRKKRWALNKKGENIQTKGPKPVWSTEELEAVAQGFNNKQTAAQILQTIPGRSFSSVSQKTSQISKELINPEERIKNLPWVEANKDGFVLITEDQWPGQKDLNNKALYALATPAMFQNKGGYSVDKIRQSLLLAEQENKVGIRVCFGLNSQDLSNRYNNSKVPNTNRNLSAQATNLVLSSMLADGTMRVTGSNDTNFSFQLTQAANLLSANGASHLEYLIDCLSQIDLNALTPGCFSLERGIYKQNQKDGLKYTWKARLNLYNISFFKQMYQENYYKYKLNSTLDQQAVKNYSSASLTERVDNTTGETDTGSTKNLPELFYVLNKLQPADLNYYQNPGLSLAHLHMQDGDVLKVSNLFWQPRLFIQTIKPYQAGFLAKTIFEKSGIKYIPKTYNNATIQTGKVTVLYMARGSINDFLNIIQPYYHTCMDYKLPKVINPTDTVNQTNINKDNQSFDNFLKKFNQINVATYV